MRLRGELNEKRSGEVKKEKENDDWTREGVQVEGSRKEIMVENILYKARKKETESKGVGIKRTDS